MAAAAVAAAAVGACCVVSPRCRRAAEGCSALSGAAPANAAVELSLRRQGGVWRSSSSRGRSGRGRTASCSLAKDGAAEVYQGRFGPWTVDENDVKEVLGYRAGIVATAAAITTGAASLALPDAGWLQTLSQGAWVVGAAGLGTSLVLVHMYLGELKRIMQGMWLVGCAGAIYAGSTASEPLTQHIAHHPEAVWLVGPMFAALTGIAFKEGVCYGKLEAFALFLAIPALLLGHLVHMPQSFEAPLLAGWVALFSVFASRKFTQAIKDDIGDKSIFLFTALPDDEKRRVLERMQQNNSLGATLEADEAM
eukprot:jgi/Chlat1/5070/Chrsp33S05071